ncbi:MAG: molybdopterin adenylyltransferase [Clostridia bacterium]|jgi:molybdenum cofactor synthesis domain-containing protein|nr:molybdopterin adenylyltransferase [Clostridia bacterium]MDN5323543.1 molybdopterin adenylyltransferase [Clostridia bacterium]
MGKVVAVCTSPKKGMRKKNVGQGMLLVDLGLKGDAHAGFAHRQVSLLALESIEKMKKMGLDVGPGDFAENLTTQGIDLVNLPIGTRFKIGEAVLRVTQIGKECHTRCAIYYQAGDCVMPKEGIFAEVLKGGEVKVDNEIKFLPSYKLGIVTASDKGARGEREDESGRVIKDKLRFLADVADYRIVPDEKEELKKAFIELADEKKVDLILTTGGTGFSPRDVTPEATIEVIDRHVPGIPEAIRWQSYQITPKAMLSRGTAGIRGKTLIINLPGSPKAVSECLDVVLPVLDHGLEILTGQGGECAR